MGYNVLILNWGEFAMRDLAFILDIGSSKISLLACQVKKGKSSIITCIDKAYDGFMDGEFFSTEQVSSVIGNLISAMSSQLKKPISNIHIGVPSEFSACVCKRVTRSFVPNKVVDEATLVELFDGIGGFALKDDYEIISFSPLQYEIDGFVTDKLSNKRVNQFVMDCNYILVKKHFVSLMHEIFINLGIEDIDFVSTALAQAQFARGGDTNKLQPIIIVDIGHITTSVAVSKGDGLLMLSSFSLGGGHITADLMQVSNLSYAEADMIKHKVALTIQAKKDEQYVAYNNGKAVKAIINITNDIVKARLENIAMVVERVLSNPVFKDLPIYLTGDGVCNFRGIINMFEAVSGRKIHLLKSHLHNGADKFQTSKISLVNIIGDLV